MTFSEAISSGFRNYVGFSGRASRSEFWYWVLFSVLVSIACQSLILVAVGQNHGAFVNLEPGDLTAIALHDTDRSGWWWLISFIPLVGIIVLIVFWCLEGTPGSNRFGADPLGTPQGA